MTDSMRLFIPRSVEHGHRARLALKRFQGAPASRPETRVGLFAS
jgi:hypothetical protein